MAVDTVAPVANRAPFGGLGGEKLPPIPAHAMRLQTTAQLCYRPYGDDASEVFRVPRTYGKPSDKTTFYREQVFKQRNIWNIQKP